MAAKKFTKGQKVKTKSGKLICIVADSEWAVFGKLTQHKDGSYSTKLNNLVLIHQIENENFIHEKIN